MVVLDLVLLFYYSPKGTKNLVNASFELKIPYKVSIYLCYIYKHCFHQNVNNFKDYYHLIPRLELLYNRILIRNSR